MNLFVVDDGVEPRVYLGEGGEEVTGLGRILYHEHEGVTTVVLELGEFGLRFLPNPKSKKDLPRPEVVAELRANMRRKPAVKSKTDTGNGASGRTRPRGPFRNPDDGGGASMAAAA